MTFNETKFVRFVIFDLNGLGANYFGLISISMFNLFKTLLIASDFDQSPKPLENKRILISMCLSKLKDSMERQSIQK